MNPSDNQIERLLQAAQTAHVPIPDSSPWFEQRVINALKADVASSNLFDGALVFRMLLGAAAIMLIGIALPLAQTSNPYTETIETANSTVQLEKIP